jgi:hypothetical protein
MQIVQATLMTGHILIRLLLLILPFRLMALQTVNCPSDAVAPTPPAVTDGLWQGNHFDCAYTISCYL